MIQAVNKEALTFVSNQIPSLTLCKFSGAIDTTDLRIDGMSMDYHACVRK